MTGIEIETYYQWIDANVREPHNNCFFYAAAMAMRFTELTLVKGCHSQQFKEDTAHFWLVDEDGNPIDPTAVQYDGGELTEVKKVDVLLNVDFVIDDPLFETLDDFTKTCIRSVKARYDGQVKGGHWQGVRDGYDY